MTVIARQYNTNEEIVAIERFNGWVELRYVRSRHNRSVETHRLMVNAAFDLGQTIYWR